MKLPFWLPKTFFIAVTLCLIALFGSQTARAAGVCYVNTSAVGANNGASWTDAYTDLQSALGVSPCTEIWVAAGNYRPTSGANRTISFTLKNGVALYGGFAGTETLRQQRDWTVNVATLNGDIGITSDTADNSYHVIISSGTNSTAILDGFTITGGNANGYDYDLGERFGGGMWNDNSNPTLTNLTFSHNTANFGGGVYNNTSMPTLANVNFSENLALWGGAMVNWSNSSPTLTDVVFSNNIASSYGGGIYNQNSNPILANVIFSDNSSSPNGAGGGIYNEHSNPTLTNVTFSNNLAFYGGGIVNDSGGPGTDGSSPTLINVTFSGNSASYGGGMWNSDGSSPTLINATFSGNAASSSGGGVSNSYISNPTFTNVTFSGNSANHGGGMYNESNSNPQIRNSIFWGNSASVNGAEFYTPDTSNPNLADSVVAGGCPSGATCANIITTDPLLGPLANNGGFTQTMALYAGSSAIDTGNDATCASTDQRGVTRPQGAHCDMGAYEWIDYAYQIYLPLVFR